MKSTPPAIRIVKEWRQPKGKGSAAYDGSQASRDKTCLKASISFAVTLVLRGEKKPAIRCAWVSIQIYSNQRHGLPVF